MALGNTNITTTLVGNTLGISSKNVGALCSSNNINRWSPNKPKLNMQFETTDEINTSIAINRITRNQTDRYYLHYIKSEDFSKVSGVDTDWYIGSLSLEEHPFYKLGDFRGYNHNAVEPKIKNRYIELFANSTNGILYIEFEGMENLTGITNEIGAALRLDYYNATFTKINDNKYYTSITLSGGVFADDTVQIVQNIYGNFNVLIANRIMLKKVIGENEYHYFMKKSDAEYATNFIDNFDRNFGMYIKLPTNYSGYNMLRPKFFNGYYNEFNYPNFTVYNSPMLWTSFDDPNNLQLHFNCNCYISPSAIGLPTNEVITVTPTIELWSLNTFTNQWYINDVMYLSDRFLKVGVNGGFFNYLGIPNYFDAMGYVVESSITEKPFLEYLGSNNENWSTNGIRLVLTRTDF